MGSSRHERCVGTGILLLGGLIAGAGLLGYKRWIA